MTMYKYYAVIEREKLDQSGCYIVSFPDLDNCFTDAETLPSAVENAHEVLEMMLTEMEADGDKIPAPSPVSKLKASLPDEASLVLIQVNTENFGEAVQ